MVGILTMSTKLATLGLLKIKVFWNKGYDVIISFSDVRNNILLRELKLYCRCGHVTKIGNSSISMIDVIITSILQEFDQKNNFFEGCSWLKFNNLKLALGKALEFYTSVANGLKLKVRKFWDLIVTCVEGKMEINEQCCIR